MQNLPISISVGILAGIWTYISIITGFLTWPAFAGWAAFFFAGGNNNGIVKAIPPAIAGIVLGYFCVLLNQYTWGGTVALSVLVTVIAFIMTFLMNVSIFSLAPSAFLSCAVFFGSGDPIKAAIPFFIGLIVLGASSVAIANIIKKAIGYPKKQFDEIKG
jgi:hypothetical protein